MKNKFISYKEMDIVNISLLKNVVVADYEGHRYVYDNEYQIIFNLTDNTCIKWKFGNKGIMLDVFKKIKKQLHIIEIV